MEGMLRPTCTCPSIIPDLEPIPIKLDNVLLSFSYDSKMFNSAEKYEQVLIICSCYKIIHSLCHQGSSRTVRKVLNYIQVAPMGLINI